MSVELIRSVTRTARKDHEDSAGVWIDNALSDIRSFGIGDGKYDLTFSEWREIAKLKAKGWKILKGEVYQDSVTKQDGEIFSFKCNPKINAICNKLDMYDNC
jgi:hypothetical protein